MNTHRIYELVTSCSGQFTKRGPLVVDGRQATEAELADAEKGELPKAGVIEVFDMPPVDAIKRDDAIRVVDVHFIAIAVHADALRKCAPELHRLLSDPEWPKGREVSYIEAGGILGDQGFALQLLAVGEVAGFWSVLTPEKMLPGLPASVHDDLAGRGYVTTSSFNENWKPSEKAA